MIFIFRQIFADECKSCILEKELKAGNRGKVLLLRDQNTKNRLIYREFRGKAEVYQRLLSLESPYLPRILAVTAKGEYTFVLEEYIQGDPLSFLLSNGPLPPPQTAPILRQLCLALEVLHSADIVHRDVKPENIILRGDEAVLIDFDAARLFKAEQRADTQLLGTGGYAAPEQFGFSQSDQRSDIYAMGILINEMLTRRHPSSQLADAPYRAVISRCIEVNADRRFASAAELRAALDAAAAPTAFPKWKWLIPLAAAALLLSLCLYLAPGGRSDPSPSPSQDSSPALIDVADTLWSGPCDDTGRPMTEPMYFSYDLNSDGAAENYVFGISIDSASLGSRLIPSDEVGLSAGESASRVILPCVWRVGDGDTLTVENGFAPLLTDAAITVYAVWDSQETAPEITVYPSEWAGGLRIRYTHDNLGPWMYEATAQLNDLTLRSVSMTLLNDH